MEASPHHQSSRIWLLLLPSPSSMAPVRFSRDRALSSELQSFQAIDTLHLHLKVAEEVEDAEEETTTTMTWEAQEESWTTQSLQSHVT